MKITDSKIIDIEVDDTMSARISFYDNKITGCYLKVTHNFDIWMGDTKESIKLFIVNFRKLLDEVERMI